MRKSPLLLIILPLLVLLLAGWTSAPRKTIFSELKPGQAIGVKDLEDAYQLSLWDEGLPQSHQVVEIGEDFIIVEDQTKVTRTTIPVYAIKAVVRYQTP